MRLLHSPLFCLRIAIMHYLRTEGVVPYETFTFTENPAVTSKQRTILRITNKENTQLVVLLDSHTHTFAKNQSLSLCHGAYSFRSNL
jgi:hypothetical protein